MDRRDEQRSVWEPLAGALPRRANGHGRPWRGSREVLNGILCIVRTEAHSTDLPAHYPPYQTCRSAHRRFQHWVRDGRLGRILDCVRAATVVGNLGNPRFGRWRRGQR